MLPSLLVALLVGAGRTLSQIQPESVYEPPADTQGTVPSNRSSGVNQQWANLMGNALYFYDVQRAGTLPNDFRVEWRNDTVPDDGKDVGLDLSGGFFDAGNFVKATFPLCWVVTQLSWSASMFGKGYDDANQTAYLDETLRTALDWLLEASSTPNEMVVFIGLSDFYWGPDTSIPSDRPSFVISNKKPGTDVFGSCASAFASASLLYGGTPLPISTSANGSVASLQNSSYASTLLERSETLFSLAKDSKPQQVYQKATDGVKWAYPSTDYADELVLSSTFLALATGNETYAEYAQQIYKDNQFPFPDGALNWDQHTSATPVLLAQLAVSQPSMDISLSKYQTDAESWLDGVVNGSMEQTFSTPGGLFWFKGDSDSASLNPSLNAAALMLMYERFSSSDTKASKYRTFAKSQVDYALGKNPMNAVYPVGMHPNSPQNPQSCLAAGGSNPLLIDTDPPVEAHVLYGGLVGGPDEHDNYYDERSNYTQTEVALDSQSPLLVIAAYHLANNASDPFYTSLKTPRVILPYEPNGGLGGSTGLSSGAKAGIAIGVIVGVLALVALISFLLRKRIRGLFRNRKFDKLGKI